LIIIPEEAEEILSVLSEADSSPTNLLTYAAPVTRKMLQFNDFKFYSVPTLPDEWEAPMWLRVELGLFAGRLYFGYFEYKDLCEYLGIDEATSRLQEDAKDAVISGMDGLVDEPMDDEVEVDVTTQESKAFTIKPLTFLREWLAVRRKGQDFSHTPMGHVCQGKPLSESHLFFMRSSNPQKKSTYARREGTATTEIEEDVEEELFDEDEYGDDVGFDENDGFDDSQLRDEEDAPQT
jgi:hypothetical protein